MYIIFEIIHTLNKISGFSRCGLSSTICSKYSHNDSNVSLHACSKFISVLKQKQIMC